MCDYFTVKQWSRTPTAVTLVATRSQSLALTLVANTVVELFFLADISVILPVIRYIRYLARRSVILEGDPLYPLSCQKIRYP